MADEHRKSDESIKETFESIVIAFILAFVFRAYVVEAFVIPTGSMAPTLMGQHLRVTCSQCGYAFTFDQPDGVARRGYQSDALCPMCNYPNRLPERVNPVAGDRILVHKYIYSLTEPRRWDVIVFKAPHDPDTNFIKRLVGLPNENVAIVEGNIYVQRHAATGEPASAWRIARKTEGSRGPRIQDAVWQPIYRSQYTPLDDGSGTVERVQHPWSQPWVPQRESEWTIQPRRGYTFTGQGSGVLDFDFGRVVDADGSPGLYMYNQQKYPGPMSDTEPIEDIRLAVVIQPHAEGASVTLSTTARLDGDGGPLPLRARVDADRAALLTIDPRTGDERVLGEVPAGNFPSLDAGRSRLVELWYVDQEARLWIDGTPVVTWQYDLPDGEALAGSPILTRPGPALRPEISIEVAGGGSPVQLHRIELDRDLFYGSVNPNTRGPGRGCFIKGDDGRVEGRPMTLVADSFFVLGDNSPQSSDGRFWDEPESWIRDRMFDRHGPSPDGIVPRKLLIGRAFFVYFPGPYGWSATSPQLIPNFGDMRFIH